MRTITSLNFWGGFCGGVLGILATAKFGGLVLMAGCLVGVMFGFYYQELWQTIKDSWNDAGRTITGPRTGPTFAEQWAAMHPYDKASYIKKAAMWIAAPIHIGIVAFVMFLITESNNAGTVLLSLVLGSLGVLFGCIIRFSSEPSANEKDWNAWGEAQVRYYFRLQELYAKHGAFFLFVREFALGFVSCFAMLAALAALLSGIVGAIVLMATVWPIGAAVIGTWFLALFTFFFMRGTYRLAMKPDHWSCLIVTIAITGMVAYLGQSYLEGAALALTALVAGLLSGFAAVQVHPALHRFFERNPRLARFFARKSSEHKEMFFEIGRALVSPHRYQLKVRDTLIAAIR